MTWKNPRWGSTPDWLRPILMDLENFLASPTFKEKIKIVTGEPTYDADKDVTVQPTPVEYNFDTLPADTGEPPPKVTDVVVTPGFRTVLVEWNTDDQPEAVRFANGTYEVQLATNSGFSTGLQTQTVTSGPTSFDGLTPGTTYYVRVRAVDHYGREGNWSDTESDSTSKLVSEEIEDAAVTTAALANDAVDVDKLADLSVTAAKLNAKIGGGNVVINSAFRGPVESESGVGHGWSAYTFGSSGAASYSVDADPNFPGDFEQVITITTNDGFRGISQSSVPTPLGKPAVASAWVRTNATTSVNLLVSQTGNPNVSVSVPANTPTRIVLPFTPAASTATLYIRTTTANTTLRVTRVQLEEGEVPTAWSPAASELLPKVIQTAHIADAAIGSAAIDNLAVGTAHIANGAILEAKIGDGEITNAKIADATIEDAKIVSVTAAKITSGEIQVGQTISSADYDGTDGWIIEGDGSAEFHDVLARGIFKTADTGHRLEMGTSDGGSYDVTSITWFDGSNAIGEVSVIDWVDRDPSFVISGPYKDGIPPLRPQIRLAGDDGIQLRPGYGTTQLLRTGPLLGPVAEFGDTTSKIFTPTDIFSDSAETTLFGRFSNAGAQSDASHFVLNFTSGIGTKRVFVGAANSGGSGFRMLRVAN